MVLLAQIRVPKGCGGSTVSPLGTTPCHHWTQGHFSATSGHSLNPCLQAQGRLGVPFGHGFSPASPLAQIHTFCTLRARGQLGVPTGTGEPPAGPYGPGGQGAVGASMERGGGCSIL